MRRFMVAIAVLLGGVFLASAPAQAQPSCADYISDISLYLACAGTPTIVVTPNTTPGGPITADLVGWLPGSAVVVTIDCNGSPVTLGTVIIGVDSRGTGSFTVPATCPLGPTTVKGIGADMLSVGTTKDGPTVLGATATNTTRPVAQLPLTGSNTTGRLVTMGAALVVIGAAALYGSLRARHTARG